MKVRIGVIGLGARMKQVLEHLLPLDERLHLAAVCDPRPAALTDASRLSADVKHVADFRELASDASLDWVFVGSWNCFHADHVIAAMEAGKHVFCEKPLATTFEDCLRIRDAVARSDRQFFFGFVLRYSPYCRQIAHLVKSGSIGKIVSFEFNEAIEYFHGGYIFGGWRRHTRYSGSHILEKCCHDLDLANWMTDSLPIRVASFGGRNVFTARNRQLGERAGRDSHGRTAYRQWHDQEFVDPFSGDTDLLDNQVVIIEYANGVRACFHANANAGLPERRFYIQGTAGTLRAEAYSRDIQVKRVGVNQGVEDCRVPINGTHLGGDPVMAAHLADTMLTGRRPMVGIDEAVSSAAVAFAIDQAHASGQVVDLAPMWERAGIDIAPKEQDESAPPSEFDRQPALHGERKPVARASPAYCTSDGPSS